MARMISGLSDFVRAPFRAFRWRVHEDRSWRARRYGAPSPRYVKAQVLLRNSFPDAVWVESGTFLGETTHLLAAHARRVVSIEPEPKLYARAARRFADTRNVEIIHGTSESVFPSLLPELHGDVNFWLDGHYSAGFTYQGPTDTPITVELAQIEANLAKFSRLAVLVDDVRCFDPSQERYAAYPPVDFLVDWARRNGLVWHIEHDIFVARRPGVVSP